MEIIQWKAVDLLYKVHSDNIMYYVMINGKKEAKKEKKMEEKNIIKNNCKSFTHNNA